ncbi:NAD(P)-binding protein [Aspergillus steynii IBT 23096]|uniref:NAD(P)-binding protein n=1 Tax=Aspergillus steynii IBT 23096 TaxID=1392250 RepID=A0A2I2GE14_9EURO|nr:NAD(P)-binding protein [Aspergillus steynii IBT 23096]PLB51146.1 NAD(P)-binding protein [Aspergillus steynii IBT 23096]
MTTAIKNVAIIGASGLLGSRISTALMSTGHHVAAIQRPSSEKQVPAGVQVIKADLNDEAALKQAFTGIDAVISAVGLPSFETEKVWIDAAFSAGVKRIIPSEFTTNMESPITIQLPVATEKVKVRQYLQSRITSPSAPTTWTSLNNGPFFDLTIKFGALGPNPLTQQAVFHNGGNNPIGPSTLSDIATAVARILDPAHLAETANQPVHIYSVAITERKLTALVSKITGVDFGSVEDGRIPDLNVSKLLEESNAQLAKGDFSVMMNYYYAMMYEEGYGGKDFEKLSWNERLGIRVMNDEELEEAVRGLIAN